MASRVKAKNHIPSLDGLRAVAIVIVVWGHAELPRLIPESTGVTLFFFLSGYLITTLLRAEADKRGGISLKDFYLRRVLRIFPPLYIVLAASIVLSLFGLLANSMTAGGIFSSATFLTNYFIIFEGRDGLPGGMNALWSLAVEEHYYIFFPLLYIAMRKWTPSRLHQTMILVALCLGIMLWRCYLVARDAGFDRIYLASDTRADSILWGALLAIAANPFRGEIPMPRRAWLLTPVLLVSAGVFYGVTRLPSELVMSVGYTIQAIAIAGIFIPLIMAPKSLVGLVLNWRPVAFLGVLSYSLYLWHRPLLFLAEDHLNLPHVVEAFIGVAAALILAYLVHKVVDQPIGRWRKRLQPPAAPPEKEAPGRLKAEGATLP